MLVRLFFSLNLAVLAVTAQTQKEVYYTFQRDLRKCVSPICGGYFISTLNKNWTRCADRTRAASCYVAAFDLSGLGLVGEDQNRFLDETSDGVVAGSYKLNAYASFKGIANLVVSKGLTPFKATKLSNSTCNCAEGGVCIDDPTDKCVGCNCPVVCRKGGPIYCGGPNGLPCPGNLQCVVDDSSTCDHFATKCIGICASIATDAARCGSRGGIQCPENQGCFDDPLDKCDPRVDCAGFCGKKVGSFCGGFAGFSCGEGLVCVDLKGGVCDNSCGGADCGGVCLFDDAVPLN
jgi:hypothetical protein